STRNSRDTRKSKDCGDCCSHHRFFPSACWCWWICNLQEEDPRRIWSCRAGVLEPVNEAAK
ncbi:Uncharacterized protein DAT39_017473, partial [Clarias magur]